MGKVNNIEEKKLPLQFSDFKRWLFTGLPAWLRPTLFPIKTIGIWLTARLLLWFFGGVQQQANLWEASFALQVIGLGLSAGVLIGTVKTHKLSLRKMFGAWLAKFPRLRRRHATMSFFDSINAGVSVTSMTIETQTRNTPEQQIEWLMAQFAEMKKTQNAFEQKALTEISTLNSKLEHNHSQVYHEHKRIWEGIASVSTSNLFYVLAGLCMLSFGSLLSLFLPTV